MRSVTLAGAPSRRLFLKLVGALPATAYLSHGCGADDPRYLTDIEHRVLTAYANAIFPADDAGPGAGDLGAADFIDALLTAFEHEPPRIHAAGPFSDRHPFPNPDGTASNRYSPDQFREFLPLSRVQRAGWRLRLYGSRGVPGGGPNDDVLGPVIGLRELLRDGVATAVAAFPMPVDQVDDAFLEGIHDYLSADVRPQLDLLVLQSLFSLPEYGGNRDGGGWRIIHHAGDSMPFGYTYIDPDTGQIQDRPEAPVIGPEADPEPMDAEIIGLYSAAVVALGGKQFY